MIFCFHDHSVFFFMLSDSKEAKMHHCLNQITAASFFLLCFLSLAKRVINKSAPFPLCECSSISGVQLVEESEKLNLC